MTTKLKTVRLGCVNCDAALDFISQAELAQAIAHGWTDVEGIQTFEEACRTYDDPADAPSGYSVFDWWTHLGCCPECSG